MTITQLSWLAYLSGLALFASSLLTGWRQAGKLSRHPDPDRPAWVARAWSALALVTLGNGLWWLLR